MKQAEVDAIYKKLEGARLDAVIMEVLNVAVKELEDRQVGLLEIIEIASKKVKYNKLVASLKQFMAHIESMNGRQLSTMYVVERLNDIINEL